MQRFWPLSPVVRKRLLAAVFGLASFIAGGLILPTVLEVVKGTIETRRQRPGAYLRAHIAVSRILDACDPLPPRLSHFEGDTAGHRKATREWVERVRAPDLQRLNDSVNLPDLAAELAVVDPELGFRLYEVGRARWILRTATLQPQPGDTGFHDRIAVVYPDLELEVDHKHKWPYGDSASIAAEIAGLLDLQRRLSVAASCMRLAEVEEQLRSKVPVNLEPETGTFP